MKKLSSNRKGIVMAGGTGTRLYPMTMASSKQLLPVYDKPMIYYAIGILMLAGIRDTLVISTPDDLPLYKKLLGDGESWGIQFSYQVQEKPNGLAAGLVLAKDFLAGAPSVFILGDNIFYGYSIRDMLMRADEATMDGARVFAYRVHNPEEYGVVEFDDKQRVIDLVEKPENPKSHYAVTGLYFYDGSAPMKAKSLQPSGRGELEITDLNKVYLRDKKLSVEIMPRGFCWFDSGTPDSLLAAGQYVATIETRQGLKICCPEEIAWRQGWIDDGALKDLAMPLLKNNYGKYLLGLLDEK